MPRAKHPAPLDGQIETPATPEVRETIQAPYAFTDEELSLMGFDLRTYLDQVDALRDQQKASNSDFKLRIENALNHSKQLRLKLNSGHETRPLEAIVEFDTPRSKKRYLRPDSRDFIREEDMQPADWQLPMFRKEEVELIKPSKEVAASVKPTIPTGPALVSDEEGRAVDVSAIGNGKAGKTSLGDTLDAAVAKGTVPNIVMDLTCEDWGQLQLTNAFKKAAKLAVWDKTQISLVIDLLKKCTTVEAMLETLRPFATPPSPAARQETPNSDESFPL